MLISVKPSTHGILLVALTDLEVGTHPKLTRKDLKEALSSVSWVRKRFFLSSAGHALGFISLDFSLADILLP